MNDNEYATVPAGAQPRSPLTSAMRTILRGISDRLVSCIYCQDSAVLLRTRFGKPTPLCSRHAADERIDLMISEQRARADKMRAPRG